MRVKTRPRGGGRVWVLVNYKFRQISLFHECIFLSSAMTLAKAATCRRWRVARSSGDMKKYVFTIPDTPFLKKEVKFIKVFFIDFPLIKNFQQLDWSLKEIKITGVMKKEKVLRDFLDLLDALSKIIRKFKPKIERLDFSGLQMLDSQEINENEFHFIENFSNYNTRDSFFERFKIWSKLPPKRFWDKKARHWARFFNHFKKYKLCYL